MTQVQVIDLNAYKLSKMLQGDVQDLPNPEPIRTAFKRCKCNQCEGKGLLRVINIFCQPVPAYITEPMPSHLKAVPVDFEDALRQRGTLPPHMVDFTCWACSGTGANWREVLLPSCETQSSHVS